MFKQTLSIADLIERAENNALVHYLGVPLQKLKRNELYQGLPVALVDTQPGAGNNPLPQTMRVLLVIDHHVC